MALCTFSEITAVADNASTWNGEFDFAWYDADATELYIANADQLAAFGAIVGGMMGYEADSFSGKTVKLLTDIDLNDDEAIASDIETYGLFTYEELKALCPLSEKMFNEAGGAYLKISIGKGNLTYDELFATITRYSEFFE